MPPTLSPPIVAYGSRLLQKNTFGSDAAELQIRLAGFRGTVPDGDFGPGTERQVMSFQRDYMKLRQPSGIVDRKTMLAIDEFGEKYPLDFRALKCPCGQCGGFGQGRSKGRYLNNTRDEAFHRYEYPGMHRMLLWAVRAAFFYNSDHKFVITSGYRCSIDNINHNNRTTTNHHGKAIDVQVALKPGEGDRDKMIHCDAIRGRLVETADAQVNWFARNRKALEPPNIAPTWVHYDVRCYEPKYLQDNAFCITQNELDQRTAISI